jgi:tetrahydromethanopterin S-methyltransferase subunit E
MVKSGFFENDKSQLGLFFMKIGRSVWTVIFGLIIVLTFIYGVFLNKFGSQYIAILISALIFGILVFLSLNDAKEARDYYEERKKHRKNVKRL